MSPEQRGADPVRAFLSDRIAEGRMPGACWWTGTAAGAVSAGCAGRAIVEPQSQPLSLGTPFDLASLTKPLATATLAVLLRSEGRVSLDQAASRWLPELHGGPYAAVTLRDLGAHRGGLPAWRPIYLDASDRDGFVARIAAERPDGPPDGTLYSDLTFLLLGIALERAAGEALDALFLRRVAAPLELKRSGYAGRGTAFADAAATERGNDFERRKAGSAGGSFPWRTEVLRGTVHDANSWALGGVAGHAGLFGVLEDVVSMAWGVLDPSRLGLDPAQKELWLRPVGGPGSRTFGWMGCEAADSARGILESAAIGHFGFTGTSVWIEPIRGRVHVLLTNRVHPRVPAQPFVDVRRGFHAAATAAHVG